MAFDVAAETVEGTPPGPQTVIIKFASAEKAKAWYNSPDYQKVVGKRLAATKGFAVISEAMRPTASAAGAHRGRASRAPCFAENTGRG